MIKEASKCAAVAAGRQARREGRIWVLVLPLLLAVWIFSPAAETRLMPVVTEATIVSAQDAGNGWTRLIVEAEKLRDCDWRKIEWFLGTRGEGGPRVQAYFEDPPTIRGVGVLRWEGLMVRLPEGLIRSQSYGDVLHECYGPSIGMTRSWYYTSP